MPQTGIDASNGKYGEGKRVGHPPGSEMVEALQQYVAPTMGQRLMDHKVGVGGTLAGGTIAVGCALAEPCGAGVVIAGVVITTGAAIYDMATH